MMCGVIVSMSQTEGHQILDGTVGISQSFNFSPLMGVKISIAHIYCSYWPFLLYHDILNSSQTSSSKSAFQIN